MHRTEVELLFAMYREPVFRFLRRFLHDRATAEDLTQEAFVRALGARCENESNLRAWIFQIARNLARDHLRHVVRRPLPGPLTEHSAPDDDPATGIAVTAALGTLAVDDREVFLLKELGGLSYSEIAQTCGLTPDAVRSRLHRARLALRKQLT